MLYEYRVYEAMPGRLPEVHARFRDHTLRLFERHGIKVIGFWSPKAGEYTNRVIYMLAFEDPAHRESAWAAFAADPEWQKVVAETEANGPIISRVFNSFLAPTDYSPLQ